MTKIDQLNRQAIKPIFEDAESALQMVAERYGLTLKRESGSFTATAFTVKFTFQCETEGGIPADFVRLAPLYALTPEDFGKEFTTPSGTYRITGINPRRRKYPISGECVRTGKGYKFTESAVRVSVHTEGT